MDEIDNLIANRDEQALSKIVLNGDYSKIENRIFPPQSRDLARVLQNLNVHIIYSKPQIIVLFLVACTSRPSVNYWRRFSFFEAIDWLRGNCNVPRYVRSNTFTLGNKLFKTILTATLLVGSSWAWQYCSLHTFAFSKHCRLNRQGGFNNSGTIGSKAYNTND